MRNRAWATKAWHKRKNCFCNQRYLDDFAAGFRQGYEDVANGSNGCTHATTPPKSYWNWEYQSAEGQGRTAAWFSGYPHGARAAEEDGVGNYVQMQLSSSVQSEFQQAGVLPKGANVYPIQPSPMHPGAAHCPQRYATCSGGTCTHDASSHVDGRAYDRPNTDPGIVASERFRTASSTCLQWNVCQPCRMGSTHTRNLFQDFDVPIPSLAVAQ